MDGCKPNFVRPTRCRGAWMIIYLTPLARRAGKKAGATITRDSDPPDCSEGFAGRRPILPVLSCTAWGFSCPGPYEPGGELLPRLFTLTGSCLPAVCFL